PSASLRKRLTSVAPLLLYIRVLRVLRAELSGNHVRVPHDFPIHSKGVPSPDRLQPPADHRRDERRRHHARTGVRWAGYGRPGVPRAVRRTLDWMAGHERAAHGYAAYEARQSAPRPRHRTVVPVAPRGARVLRRVL